MLEILTSDARETQAEFYEIMKLFYVSIMFKIKINKYINIYLSKLFKMLLIFIQEIKLSYKNYCMSLISYNVKYATLLLKNIFNRNKIIILHVF